jgi:hypothetical protein
MVSLLTYPIIDRTLICLSPIFGLKPPDMALRPNTTSIKHLSKGTSTGKISPDIQVLRNVNKSLLGSFSKIS